LADGHYAVDVPLDGHDGSVLLVEARDVWGDLVARREARRDGGVTDLDLEQPPGDAENSPPRLLMGSVDDVIHGVAHLQAAEALPEGSSTVLDIAVGRLAWLDGLVEPAQRALLGDASAASAVREALRAWAGETEFTAHGRVIERGGEGEQRQNGEDALPDVVYDVVSSDALGALVAAVVVVGRTVDEQAELAAGLTAVLSVRPWLAALGSAAAAGDVPTMRTLMGMPGPIPIPGNLPKPAGIPMFPGLPAGMPGGKPKRVGIKVSPTVSDVVEIFRSPLVLPPSPQQRCLVAATVEVSQIRDRAPFYRLKELLPADACPGQELIINGTSFGLTGSVAFPGTAAPVPHSAALEWTDTRIRVVVPPGAAPGRIDLRILEASLWRCGQIFTAYRAGETTVLFEGGTAAVTSFLLDGSRDPIRVEPGVSISISCHVTPHGSATTQIWVTQGGATVADFGPVAGGGHRQQVFTAPPVTAPRQYEVHMRVSGPCGEDEHVRTVMVAARPKLSIAHLEVTQGLQDVAHTVRLVEGRTTAVRAFVTSGLGPFSYTGTPSEVGNVQGTLFVERNGIVVATVPAAAPLTVTGSFIDADRATAGRALNFLVPGHLVQGDVTMRVTVRVSGLPGFGTEVVGTSWTRTVRAESSGPLTVVRLRMRDDNPASAAAEPSIADWQASGVGTADRYPLADAGLVVRVPTSGDVLATTGDLLSRDGWSDVLDDLDDFADRFDDFDSVFACVVPANAMYGFDPDTGKFTNGLAHAAVDRPWPLPNDRRVMLAQKRKPGTFAHEMAHTLGVGHAPCGGPKNVDPRLPGALEPGTVGWRRSDGVLFPSGHPELMSYCPPPNPLIYDDRWPSAALWNILFGIVK